MTAADRKSDSPSALDSACFLLLCIIFIFAVVAYGAVDPISTSILAVLTLLLVLIWTANAFRKGKFSISNDRLQIPIVILIAIALFQLLPLGITGDPDQVLSIPASQALTMDPFATRMFAVRLVLLLVFLAAALTFVNSGKRVKSLVMVLIAFGMIAGFFGIIQKLADPGAIYGLRPTPQAIPFGSYVNQHHFASLMVMLLGPALGLVFTRGVRKDLFPLLIIAVIIMATAAFFTGSRGGIISLLSTLTLILIYSRGSFDAEDSAPNVFWRRGAGILALGLVLIGAIIGLAVLLGGGESVLRGIGLSTDTEDVTSGRLHYWSVALKIFAEHPILGAGFDAFSVAFPQLDTRNGLFRIEQAHNEYLQILAEGGLIGILPFVIFLWFLFVRARKAIGSASSRADIGIRVGSTAGCFGVLVHSIFDFPLRTHFFHGGME
ncbi:O-antigen ligase family protein [Leptolyngbya sp. 7M]|uniref:O-antigen ligase family protein n=1 Tax=Leptolyngbya sp. 7M TaxID=2812896 RepID=UPI001B8B3AD6|nr:O-antigen ligase family protein [Leptolyngbya sp. 7M]QYO63067.1 O-antigen ligase family protein [Leptolyngbya sp. 7M]